MLTAEQIEERRKGIGASDAAKIIAGDWYQLWLEKTARAEPEDLSHVWAVRLGSHTEALNLDWYHRVRPVSRRGEHVVSGEYPMLRCTLDGFDAMAPAVIEAKHVNAFAKLPDVIAKYTPQVIHQMIVTQTPHGYLSVIVGANEPVLAEIEYDEFWAMTYIDRCVEFWRHVTDDIEPDGAPPPIAAPTPIEKMRIVSFEGNNAWAQWAGDWLENQKAAKTFDAAAKELKGLVDADVKEATGHGIKITRDGRGLKIGASK